MKTMYWFFYLLLFFSSFNLLLSRQIHLSGQILDKGSNESLPFVNVGVVGKNIATVTEMTGRFMLKIPEALLADTLKCSMNGYFYIERLRHHYF